MLSFEWSPSPRETFGYRDDFRVPIVCHVSRRAHQGPNASVARCGGVTSSRTKSISESAVCSGKSDYRPPWVLGPTALESRTRKSGGGSHFSALLGRKNRLPLPLQSLPAVGRFALWAHTGAQGAALWKNLGRTCFRGTIFLYRPALRPAASRWDHKFSAPGNLSSREPWGGRQHGLHRAKAAAHGLGNGAMVKRPLCTTLACTGWAGCPCSAPAANATCVKRPGAPDPECV